MYMKQFEKEKIDQILYDKEKNFLVRSRMIEYMKTVTIDDLVIVEATKVEGGVEEALERNFEPSEGVLNGNVMTFTPLSGKQPDYPTYNGEPTI